MFVSIDCFCINTPIFVPWYPVRAVRKCLVPLYSVLLRPGEVELASILKYSGRLQSRIPYIGKETIDIVHEYTNLGTRISSTGNFNISLEHLKEKALHALFSLRKHTNFSKLKPSLACKIFEAMISPILSYNSEIWGVHVKHDFKAWDNTQLK